MKMSRFVRLAFSRFFSNSSCSSCSSWKWSMNNLDLVLDNQSSYWSSASSSYPKSCIVSRICASALERTMNTGILNRLLFWIMEISISVKRYVHSEWYSQLALNMLDRDNCRIIYWQHDDIDNKQALLVEILSVGMPAPGQSNRIRRLYGVSLRESWYPVVDMAVLTTPTRAAWRLWFIKPQKASTSDDFPDPELS